MTDAAITEFTNWLSRFGAALAEKDVDGVASMFEDGDCFWRDFVAFTWNIATMDGRAAIRAMLEAQLDAALPASFEPDASATKGGGVVEGWFSFETATARGRGHARLRGGKCWTLLTAMTELKGYEEPAGYRRPYGLIHTAGKHRRTWRETVEDEHSALGATKQPYCLIVGGSQGGLALAARLKRLGVPTIVVDALPQPGDAWRNRYRSLYLHDAVWADHLPYLPYPDHWPIFMSKDKMADWLQAYAKIMELNFWGSTTCRAARFDAADGRWTVTVEREGKPLSLRPKHLILATGLSGFPNTPDIPGASSFLGAQYHSSRHKDGLPYAGKNCIVIGANNSAHDIAVDLWAVDAKVTMIQRSPTTVVSIRLHRRINDEGPLSEKGIRAGITTEQADLMMSAWPFRLKETVDRAMVQRIRREDADFYARLAASGFMLDFGPDETGIGGKYFRRASGYYIDEGCSALIANGEIAVKTRTGVSEIRPRSVVLENGEELPADLIVYATGYGPMENWVESLISKEVADKVGRVWGLGSDTPLDPGPWEGELRNMWKPTAQEGLWFHGGNLAQSRFHSLHLALQLKARMEGIATPVHRTAPIMRPPLSGG